MYTYLADKNKPDQVSIISQDEIIRRITGDEELKTEVSEIRRLTKRYEQSNDLADRNEKEALKTKLPAFVPAGEFSYRDTKSLTKYRGRIVMDIDKIKDPERLRALIKSNREPSVIMAFLSPSGNGLKVIHQLDCPDLKSIEETGDFHKQAFLSLINLYKSKYKVTEIDLSGSDLCRLCYYSFDDKAYYNPDAKSWTFEYRTKTERSISTLNSKIEGYYPRSGNDPERANLKVVQNIIHWSMNENVSLLDNYNDWIRVMFALKNTFGNSKIGFELFSQLSSTSYKYKPEECARKWEENTADNNGQMATIGTIIYLAKKNGWRPPRALHIGLNSDVNTKITELEENNIRVRRNELSHQFHYAESIDKDIWILGDEYLFSKIKLTLFGFTTKTEAVVDLLNYISPKFNPVKDFLSSLPEWDGRDRFSELIATLTLKNTADLKMAESLLRKWMIGVINGLHNCPENSGNSSISPNENMLILIGPQGIGKTR
ncbi:MAG TPA: BT4734/BF3469 family protein, partial [Candidatus Cloacimonadota bacterium]|nr:BT4734/BF3469 family protein [Candidatus Cloacimonadota bacterium]